MNWTELNKSLLLRVNCIAKLEILANSSEIDSGALNSLPNLHF